MFMCYEVTHPRLPFRYTILGCDTLVSIGSDDESIGSSISYIILSNSKTDGAASPIVVLDFALVLDTDSEPFEAPPSLDYASTLDDDIEFLESPTSPDYTSDSDSNTKPFEEDHQEADLDLDKRCHYATPYMIYPNGRRLICTLRKTDTTDETMIEAIILARLCKKLEACRWTFVVPRIRAWRDHDGLPNTFKLGESSSVTHVLLVTSEHVHHTVPLLVGFYHGLGLGLLGLSPETRDRLVPSCFAIFDLEPLSLSFDFFFSSKIFKSLSFNLDHHCYLAILCLDQHAHILHHLESLLTISLDRLDILKEDLVYQSLRKSLSLCLSFRDS
nr:hypothetical protein [Tanacetum cinerariifolium]